MELHEKRAFRVEQNPLRPRKVTKEGKYELGLGSEKLEKIHGLFDVGNVGSWVS